MSFPLYIAKRYMFSKKSHNAINIISIISVCALAFATLAMVVTMSIFNGFIDVISDSFTNFDPDLKITAKTGKVFVPDSERFDRIKKMQDVQVYTATIKDNAMVRYKDKQTIVVIKGVEDNFNELTSIENILYGNGEFILKDEVVDYATMGVGLVKQLNCGLKFLDALEVYAPKRQGKINMANPASSLRKGYLYSSGSVFTVGQMEYDESYIITSMDFARNLFDYKNEVSAIELKLKDGCDHEKVKNNIKNILGDSFLVENRYEQQKEIFGIMNIEKLISFIFLTFILFVASMNVISTIAMLLIEKRENIKTIQNLGADKKSIFKIFLYEGWIISLLGAVSGIIIGVAISLIQQHFGIVSLGNGNSFITDAYPVRVEFTDILAIFATVLITVLATIWFPTKSLCRKLLDNTEKQD